MSTRSMVRRPHGRGTAHEFERLSHGNHALVAHHLGSHFGLEPAGEGST